MPIIYDDTNPLLNQPIQGQTEPTKAAPPPSLGETFGAAFNMENDMVSIWNLAQRKHFPPENNFDISEALPAYDKLNKTNIFENYRDRFVGVRSSLEMKQKIDQIKRENEYTKTLERAGGWGVVANMLAGTVSPTILLPFVGEARGLQAIAKAGMYAGLGAGIQETALYNSQETRTVDQGLFSVAASTFIGGILGGAHIALRPGERVELEARATKDAREIQGKPDIVPVEPKPGEAKETVQVKSGPEAVEASATPPKVEEEINLPGRQDILDEKANAEVRAEIATTKMTPEQEAKIAAAIKTVGGETVNLSFEDEIKISQGQKASAGAQWGRVADYANGKFSPTQDAITISRASADLGTAYHEAFHRLQDLVMSLQERGLLNKARPEMERLVEMSGLTKEQIAKMSDKEVQAEAFAQWMKTADAPPPNAVAGAWAKLKDLLTRVKNLAQGWGFRTAEDIFKEARSGKLGKRGDAMSPAARQARYEMNSAQFGRTGESFQPAWHGSPHWFSKFMLKFVGEGEGAQVFGWGLYFAQLRGIGEYYRDKLAPPLEKFEMVRHRDKVFDTRKNNQLMAYDAPFSKQPPHVQEAFKRLLPDMIDPEPITDLEAINSTLNDDFMSSGQVVLLTSLGRKEGTVTVRVNGAETRVTGEELNKILDSNDFVVGRFVKTGSGWGFKRFADDVSTMKGSQMYDALARKLDNVEGKGGDMRASKALAAEGVPGHRFTDSDTRDKGLDWEHPDATFNYVVYEDSNVRIEEYFQLNLRPTDEKFDKWFGNSKIVDEEGEPRIMYRASGSTDMSAARSAIDGDAEPVYASVQRPKTFTDLPDELKYSTDFEKSMKIMSARLVSEGYDGMILLDKETSIPAMVKVFDEAQIQTVYKEDAVAPTDPNISYQLAPEPPDSVGGTARGTKMYAKVFNKTVVLANPVLQVLNESPSAIARGKMRLLSDAGLPMEGNAKTIYDPATGKALYTMNTPTTEGGTVENRLFEYWGMFDVATRKVNDVYEKYVFEGKSPLIAPQARAGMRAKKEGKMSRADFNHNVTLTLWNGLDSAPNAAVRQAAEIISKEIYEPIFERAKAAGLLPENAEPIGDKGYANRMYLDKAIHADPQRFIKILADHYEQKMQASWNEAVEKFLKKKARNEQFLADASLSRAEAEQVLQQLQGEEKALEEVMPPEVERVESQLTTLRAAAKKARKVGDDEAAKQFDADAKQYEKDNYHIIKPHRDALQKVRARMNNLTRGVAAVETARSRKFGDLEKLYNKNMDALRRVAKTAQRILPDLQKVSDKVLNKQLGDLKNMFESAAEDYDGLVSRAEELASSEDTTLSQMIGIDAKVLKRMDRLNELAAKIENAQGLDRAQLRADIEEGLNLVMEKVNEVNSIRSQRMAKLMDDLEGLDPEETKAWLKQQALAMGEDEEKFLNEWKKRGDIELDTKKAVFREHALEMATEVKRKITGEMLHLPIVDMMAQERGPELARVLDIPSHLIQDFLETDITKLTRNYVRTLAPDIELAKAFKASKNADTKGSPIDFKHLVIDEIRDEYDKMSKNLAEVYKDNPAKLQKENLKLEAQYELDKENLRAVWERLRGIRGLPKDADSWTYRAGKVVMSLNVLRMMGMVLPSSLPDVARPVMRYGLTRTMRDAIIPMITNFKAFKLSALEGRYAGAATDTTAHLRATAFHDMLDDLQRGTKFERAVHYMAGHMGVVALFDIWTDGMKMMTASVANGKLMESIATMMGEKGLMKEKDALKFLSENSIGEDMVKRIWKEMKDNGGAQRVNGLWYPNTQAWTDVEALSVYRQALAREINGTIVTPGVDKPLLADANLLGRMLYQFKSFGMASNTKVVMAGLAQQDAAALNGALFALAMGGVSYYVWAVATGGKAYEDMQNAGIDKWADEMIQRSGLMGSFGEVQRVGETIPGVSDIMSFSHTKSTRRPGDDLAGTLLGPSFDALKGIGSVITGLAAPTQSTLHSLRKLMPYQQTIMIRELWDLLENSIKGVLPEKRN